MDHFFEGQLRRSHLTESAAQIAPTINAISWLPRPCGPAGLRIITAGITPNPMVAAAIMRHVAVCAPRAASTAVIQ